MSEAEILFETIGRVALIRLNRPQALNALTYAMLADIRRLTARTIFFTFRPLVSFFPRFTSERGLV